MYAIIETGSKQYWVEQGMTLDVEHLPGEPGEVHVFERVLMLGDEGEARVGRPTLDGATVSARIVEQGKGPKVVVFKMKRRKKHRVTRGHRQQYTRVEITSIEG